MAIAPTKFDQETLARVLRESFFNHVKGEIRARIMEAVKEDIDKAVDSAVELFKADLHTAYDMASGGQLMKLIVERKDKVA